jgi:hypothetical protein
MKIIITEEQLKLIVENENKDGNLLDLTDVYGSGVSPNKWDDIFLLLKEKKEKKGGRYDGYYIDGYVDLEKSNVTKLDYLVIVEGSLNLNHSQIESLAMLSKVAGDFSLVETRINTLPLLERVGWNLYFRDSDIISIPNLVSVGRGVNGDVSGIKYLPKLESVGADNDDELHGDDLTLWRSGITELPSLKYVNGSLSLGGSPLGKKLNASGMTNVEINDIFGVKGKLFI